VWSSTREDTSACWRCGVRVTFTAMTNPPTPAAERTTVLVVDDEEGIRKALERFLTRLGYQVAIASNATEALERLATDHPQAMLCDIRMPQTSGVELLPKVLAQDPDLAVIMLTAIDEPRTAIECLKLGAYDYLIKPVDRSSTRCGSASWSWTAASWSSGWRARSRCARASWKSVRRRSRRSRSTRSPLRKIGRAPTRRLRGSRRSWRRPRRRWRRRSSGDGSSRAGLAECDPPKRANQTDEGPAVGTRVALRRALLVPAGAADHPVVLFELRLIHKRLRGSGCTT